MEAYYVYMLRCRGGSLYTGMTNDVARRMAMHCSGRGAKYTRAHPPEALAALWRCGDKITASRLEYAIKAKLTHGQKETLAAAPGRIGALFPALPAEAVTTLPAPITLFFPMVTPGQMTAPAPIQQLSPIVTGSAYI